MNATLLAMATTLSGIIVFMKNVEKTSSAATHAAITIDTGHLAFTLIRTTPRAIFSLSGVDLKVAPSELMKHRIRVSRERLRCPTWQRWVQRSACSPPLDERAWPSAR